jgi:hypothetical protein
MRGHPHLAEKRIRRLDRVCDGARNAVNGEHGLLRLLLEFAALITSLQIGYVFGLVSHSIPSVSKTGVVEFRPVRDEIRTGKAANALVSASAACAPENWSRPVSWATINICKTRRRRICTSDSRVSSGSASRKLGNFQMPQLGELHRR